MNNNLSSSNFIIPFNLITLISLLVYIINGDFRFYTIGGICLLASLTIILIVMIYVSFRFGIKFVIELDINIFEIILSLTNILLFTCLSLMR